MIHSGTQGFIQKEQMIYWEKQQNKMCGLHCVNSLLQGPFYNEISLSEIAKEFDAKEMELMKELGEDTKDFLLYMAQDSINHSEDGNYSVQVIEEAIRRRGNLELKLVDPKKFLLIADHKEKLSLDDEEALVCNSGSHWFVLRKIDGIWYDLNSTNNYPEIMDEARFTVLGDLNTIQKPVLKFAMGTLIYIRKVMKGLDLNPNQIFLSLTLIRELNSDTPSLSNLSGDDWAIYQMLSPAKLKGISSGGGQAMPMQPQGGPKGPVHANGMQQHTPNGVTPHGPQGKQSKGPQGPIGGQTQGPIAGQSQGPIGGHPQGPMGGLPQGPMGKPQGPIGMQPQGPIGMQPQGPMGVYPQGLMGMQQGPAGIQQGPAGMQPGPAGMQYPGANFPQGTQPMYAAGMMEESKTQGMIQPNFSSGQMSEQNNLNPNSETNQIRIHFRLPDGSVIAHIFGPNIMLEELYEFVSKRMQKKIDFTLISNAPSYKLYERSQQPLSETDLKHNQTLFVKKVKTEAPPN